MKNRWQKITEEYSGLSSVINNRLNENYHIRQMHNIFYKWIIDLYIYFNHDILKLNALFIEFFEKNKNKIRPYMLFDSLSLLHNNKDLKLLETFFKSKNIPFNIDFPDYDLWNENDIKLFNKILILHSEEDLVVKLFWFTVYHYCPITIMKYISWNSELESVKQFDLVIKEINNLKFGVLALSYINQDFKNALEHIFQMTGAQFFALENIFFSGKSEIPFTFANFRESSRNRWDNWISKSFKEKNEFLSKKIKIYNFKDVNIIPKTTSLLVGNGFSVELQIENWLSPNNIFEQSIKNYTKFYKLFIYDQKNKEINNFLKQFNDYINLKEFTQSEYSGIKEYSISKIEKYYSNLEIFDIKKHINFLKMTAIEIVNIYLKNIFLKEPNFTQDILNESNLGYILKINWKKSQNSNQNRILDYFSKKHNRTVSISERLIWQLSQINWNDNVYYEDLALVNDIFKLDRDKKDVFNDFHFIFRLCYLETIWNKGRSWNINYIKKINKEKMRKTFKNSLYSTNYDGFLDLIMSREINHLHGSFNLWKFRNNNKEEYITSSKINQNFKNYWKKYQTAKSSIILASPIDKNNFLNYQINSGFEILKTWVENYKNDKSETLVVVGNNFFKDYWIYDSIKNNKNLKRLIITFYGCEEKERFAKQIPKHLEEIIRTGIEIILCNSKTFFDFFT